MGATGAPRPPSSSSLSLPFPQALAAGHQATAWPAGGATILVRPDDPLPLLHPPCGLVVLLLLSLSSSLPRRRQRQRRRTCCGRPLLPPLPSSHPPHQQASVARCGAISAPLPPSLSPRSAAHRASHSRGLHGSALPSGGPRSPPSGIAAQWCGRRHRLVLFSLSLSFSPSLLMWRRASDSNVAPSLGSPSSLPQSLSLLIREYSKMTEPGCSWGDGAPNLRRNGANVPRREPSSGMARAGRPHRWLQVQVPTRSNLPAFTCAKSAMPCPRAGFPHLPAHQVLAGSPSSASTFPCIFVVSSLVAWLPCCLCQINRGSWSGSESLISERSRPFVAQDCNEGLKHLELRFRLHAFLATAATHAGTPTTDLAVLYR
ncbi:hypothetical protein BDA96_04G045100 [Sorghum bicolor]|uniref:Uncharacterized protein n=1 Tax=Sorghum bicolor TaxID=4558 RepID=A0A921R0E4_SORBI|nr:hypothetical protein BDA96_04G045100 [Sorghum bicolor]